VAGTGATAGSGGTGGAGGAGTAGTGGAGTAGTGAAGSSGAAGSPADASGGTAGGTLEGSTDAPQCNLPTPDSVCDTAPQCGCDPGDKCDVLDLATGDAICVSEGSVAPYQSCLFAGCIKGQACIGGVCKPYCDSLADCPGANRECRPVQIDSGGTPVNVPGMSTCTSACDPVNPALLCGAGLTCSFNAGWASTDCFPAGTGQGIGACAGSQGCITGYICVNNQSTGSQDCLQWCRIGNPNDCNGGGVCTPLQSAPTLGGQEYGACII
jgi:hypothetical protein